MKNEWLKIFSVVVLFVCLVLSWLNFRAHLSPDSFKLWFLLLSLLYFLLAVFSIGKRSPQ